MPHRYPVSALQDVPECRPDNTVLQLNMGSQQWCVCSCDTVASLLGKHEACYYLSYVMTSVRVPGQLSKIHLTLEHARKHLPTWQMSCWWLRTRDFQHTASLWRLVPG